jgi:hypothetical protein
MRFQEPLTRAPEFVQLLEKYRTHEFGTQKIRRLEFVFNDWYQRSRATRLIGSVVISE